MRFLARFYTPSRVFCRAAVFRDAVHICRVKVDMCFVERTSPNATFAYDVWLRLITPIRCTQGPFPGNDRKG